MKFGTIEKTMRTETAHIVREAVSTRCRFNIHGHSYKWVVSITGPIQENGMVLDFKELKPIKDFVDLFDHSTVFWSKEDPEIIDFFDEHFQRVLVMQKNPTAENMARLLHKVTIDWAKNNPEIDYENYLVETKVWETDTGAAISTEHDENDFVHATFV